MQRRLTDLVTDIFDLVVIGGGITGAGVALDASLRGLRVALIDKGDFGSGTSSVSSKLIHGGLRYLEHAQFPLVQEALLERQRLLANAPHRVWPLRFLLPYYQGARVKPWQWRFALTLYDLLAGEGNLQRSRPLTLSHLRKECSFLSPDALTGAVQYFDAQMEDARLCLSVVQSAVREGACAANYVRATRFVISDGTIEGIIAKDEIGGSELFIRGRAFLNVTGPWVDELCRLAGDPSEPRLQTTKGVHLIVPDQGLLAGLLLLHPRDGRVFFVLPWLGRTLIGTTDTFDASGPDRLQVSPDDVQYLLEGFNRYLTRKISEADVIHSFAGLRPLLRGKANSASARSREFAIFDSPSGLISVAGGKYTTYRSMAQKVTDHILQKLQMRRRCRTQDYLLDGAPAGPWDDFVRRETTRLCSNDHFTAHEAEHLVRRYGTHAEAAASYAQNFADRQPLAAGQPDMQFELEYQRQHEMALGPEDHLVRRTRLGWLTGAATLREPYR